MHTAVSHGIAISKARLQLFSYRNSGSPHKVSTMRKHIEFQCNVFWFIRRWRKERGR
uniref:Uncharacterized protein n=1 Tax=Arundo donax TaxID=35708 RepID=A0A0A9A2R8_ARUDO